MALGHRIWVFPDGYLPPREPYDPELSRPGVQGHESLMVLNTGTQAARVTLQIYFPDREPWTVRLADVPGQRIGSVRLDEPIGSPGARLPEGQYSLVVEADQPVVAQFGRMDIRQPNLAYYTVMGFPVAASSS